MGATAPTTTSLPPSLYKLQLDPDHVYLVVGAPDYVRGKFNVEKRPFLAHFITAHTYQVAHSFAF